MMVHSWPCVLQTLTSARVLTAAMVTLLVPILSAPSSVNVTSVSPETEKTAPTSTNASWTWTLAMRMLTVRILTDPTSVNALLGTVEMEHNALMWMSAPLQLTIVTLMHSAKTPQGLIVASVWLGLQEMVQYVGTLTSVWLEHTLVTEMQIVKTRLVTSLVHVFPGTPVLDFSAVLLVRLTNTPVKMFSCLNLNCRTSIDGCYLEGRLYTLLIFE